jgi:hypothetical protein
MECRASTLARRLRLWRHPPFSRLHYPLTPVTFFALLLLSPPVLAVQDLESRTRVEIDRPDHGLVHEVRASLPTSPPADPGSGRSYGSTVRWEVDDAGAMWIVESVALGDHGASLMAGRFLNQPGSSLHPTGSPRAVFDRPSAAYRTAVGVADAAPTAAALSIGPDPGGSGLLPRLEVFLSAGDIGPAWTYDFPLAAGYYADGAGVCLSDDGETIFAWVGYPYENNVKVRTFRRDGTLVMQRGLGVVSGGAIPQAVRLSDDGSLALVQISDQIKLVRTDSGEVVHRENLRDWLAYSMFSGADLSGDGRRFAFGGMGEVRVFEQGPSGSWIPVAAHSFDPAHFAGPLALDSDGDRLAYTVQAGDAESFEIRLLDLASGTDRFQYLVAAPGTAAQLWASDLDLDDAGEVVACGSWGDSFHATPEGIVLDEDGVVLSEVWTDGSVMDVDLDPTGQVLALGSKDTHANHYGNGGDILCADTRQPDLSVVGYPELGGTLDLVVQPRGSWAVVAVAERLGPSPTPFGVAQLDLSSVLAQTAPLNMPPSGIRQPFPVPGTLALEGRLLHVQAAVYGAGGGMLTNRVSLRVLP